VRADPEAFRCIGEEITEMLDYQPAKFFRRRIIRRKFVRREKPELAPIIAPLPESLQQRCIAAPGLLAQVIVSKYCDHQPLYAAPGIGHSIARNRFTWIGTRFGCRARA
jgi:transposase